PDVEILAALRPGMATIPGAMLLCASSPYARRGALWDAYRRHYGNDGPVLVWQSDTRTMNPTVPQSVIDAAMAADPARAQAEYFATFRTDIEAFVAREAVEGCVALDVRERPPLADVKYFAFTDPSGGGSDSFTLAIAHRDGECAVLDCIREVRPPFSPESVVAEFAALLRSYRVSQLQADRYAAEWPREQFRKRGIDIKAADQNKSDLYLNLLPILNSRRVDLLANDKLVAQLCSLERRTSRAGRDSIDHPPSAHDDVANAVAGVVSMVLTREREVIAELLGPGATIFGGDGQPLNAPPPVPKQPVPVMPAALAGVQLDEAAQKRLEAFKRDFVAKQSRVQFYSRAFGTGCPADERVRARSSSTTWEKRR